MNPTTKRRRLLSRYGYFTLFLICSLSVCSCEQEPEITPPTISGFTPTSGTAGTVVNISGTNFSATANENDVKFNGISASISEATSELLVVTVPETASTGKITITVNDNTATSEGSFTIFNSPEITGIEPAGGLPGTFVTISGNNFSATISDNEVKFNTLDATVTAATTTSLSVTVPDGAVTGKINITVNGLTTSSANNFIVPPTITEFSPTNGIIGSSVTITGTGFSTSLENNLIKFGEQSATVTAATPTSLTVTVPENAITSIISVTVDGFAAVTSTNYVVLPQISDFTPKRGAIGSTVTISGSGFNSIAENNTVNFNGTAATVTDATGTSLTVTVPNDATSGSISVATGGSPVTSEEIFDVTVEALIEGNSNFDGAYSIAVDGSGNSYITGSFIGTTTFGNTNYTAVGYTDMFIAKYDIDLNLEWVKHLEGSGNDSGMSVVIDNSDNIYMAGTFYGNFTIGSTTFSESLGNDAFVAKLTNSGDLIWATLLNSDTYIDNLSLALDPSGYPYLTGAFKGVTAFGSIDLTSADADEDIFIAKFDPSTGNTVWAKQFGGEKVQSGTSLSINSSGDVYFAGCFFDSSAFGDITLEASGDLDAYVGKMNSSGEIVWIKQISGPDWENAISIDLDFEGNCYVAGYFGGTTSFNSTQLSATGWEDMFIAKYTPTGEVLWVKQAGSSSNYSNARSVKTDDTGNIYVTGYFTGPTFFDNTLMTSNDRDVFVAKYDTDGDILWVKKAGGAESDNGESVDIDASNTVHVTGYVRGTGTSTFGATDLTGKGSDDIFIWKIFQE